MAQIAGQTVVFGLSDGEFDRIEGTDVIGLSPYNVQSFPEKFKFWHVNGDMKSPLEGFPVIVLRDVEGKELAVWRATKKEAEVEYRHPENRYGEAMGFKMTVYEYIEPYGGAWVDAQRKFLKGIPEGLQMDFDRIEPPKGAAFLVITTKTAAPYGTIKRYKDDKEEILALNGQNTLQGEQIFRNGTLTNVQGFCSIYLEIGDYTAFDITNWIKPEITGEVVSKTVNFMREQPTPFPRLEAWNKNLTFKNGEMLISNDKVYQWNYPVSGNSSIPPQEDIKNKNTKWKEYEQYPLLSTWILFAKFALLGGAVMAEKREEQDPAKFVYAKMYSQMAKGETTDDYRSFKPEMDPWDKNQNWKPMACIDWKTGKTWFSNTTIDGDVKANTLTATEGGQIGPFKISKGELRAESPYNSGNTGGSGLKQYLSLTDEEVHFGVTGGVISSSIGINTGNMWGHFQGCAAFYNNLERTPGDVFSNNGIYINVSGANKDDAIEGSGNHALFLAKGDVVGFRPYTRRINTDGERLSIYDTLVFVVKSSINIYLPSTLFDDVEDGQFCMIVNTSGSKIRIRGTFAGTTKFVDLSSWHMGFFTYDAVNRYWCGVFSAHF